MLKEIASRRTSRIADNTRSFARNAQGEELTEPFSFPSHWADPDGPLALSAKQQRKLVDMKRFSDVMRARGLPADACAMIKSITPYSITQDTISDCSFVASLCIASAFERRFKKQLITRIIYPQVHTATSVGCCIDLIMTGDDYSQTLRLFVCIRMPVEYRSITLLASTW